MACNETQLGVKGDWVKVHDPVVGDFFRPFRLSVEAEDDYLLRVSKMKIRALTPEEWDALPAADAETQAFLNSIPDDERLRLIKADKARDRIDTIRSGAIGQKSDWKPALGRVPKGYVADAAFLWKPGFLVLSEEEYAMLPDKVVAGKAVPIGGILIHDPESLEAAFARIESLEKRLHAIVELDRLVPSEHVVSNAYDTGRGRR